MPFCWSINRRITKVVIWHICEVQGLNLSKQKFMGIMVTTLKFGEHSQSK